MNIETRSIQFDNLLVYETTQLRTDWQEGIFVLEDWALLEGIYQDGPIFFSVAPTAGEDNFGHFTYYLPINDAVQVKDNAEFRFEDRFHVANALVMRQADQEIDFYAAFEKIKFYAADNDIHLADTFYCVLLEVYDDIMIDLYVPIQDGGSES